MTGVPSGDREIQAHVCSMYRRIGFFDGLYVKSRFLLAPMVATARLVQPGSVLDLGCGNGMFAQILRALDPDRPITGIDRNAHRIRVAIAASRDDRIRFSIGDARTFELRDTTRVTMIDLLHHMPVPAQDELLSDLASRVFPGTEILIKDIERRGDWKYWLHYVQDSLSYRLTPLWFRSRQEMVALLESRGLSVRIVDLGGIHPHIAYVAIKH